MNIEKVFHLYKTPRTRILTLCRNSSKKFFARTCKPFWIPLNFILIDPFFSWLHFFYKYYHRIRRNGKIYYTTRFDTSQLHSITLRINLPQATTMVTIFPIFFFSCLFSDTSVFLANGGAISTIFSPNFSTSTKKTVARKQLLGEEKTHFQKKKLTMKIRKRR